MTGSSELKKRVATAYKMLERSPRASWLQEGLQRDDELLSGFEAAFDNHFLPIDYWESLFCHDGERPGRGGGLCGNLRLLSLRESVAFEDPFYEDAGKDLAQIRKAVAWEERFTGANRKKRSIDPRIKPYGPGLSWTIAIGAKGRRLTIDLEPTDEVKEESLWGDRPEQKMAAQLIEYLPDGKIRWVASSVADWLEALAKSTS